MVQYEEKVVTKGNENLRVSFDFAKTPITQVADYIIIAASKNKTSDIHFDPRDDGLMVRFRIDGDCQDYTFIPKAYERNLTTRLKLLANMNITETRLPQDGSIKGQFGDTYLDMRVACLPTNQGEKIVIRILDYSRSLQGVDSLGFHPKNLEKIHHMMGVPNGIILVTGATGSGKSTTTYSMLSALNKPEINVITVEDPVEMNIEGINQVQVNAEIGMTFAAALRSILREDPNVILIGEIRDSETAQIAVRASITGHLVMSTLHTNSALATVERLLDMDVERYLLSTALTGIISQRLAKQLCPHCRYQRETTKYEKKVFKKFLHQDITTIWDANPSGCDKCRKGYSGRIAVHEVLLLDDKIRNALNDEKMSKEDFSRMIYGGNTISMLQDALIKTLDGQTSFDEVYKTIEIENEDEDNYTEELNDGIINQNQTASGQPQTSAAIPTAQPVVETQVPIAIPTEQVVVQTQAPVAAPVPQQVIETQASLAIPTEQVVVQTQAPVAAPVAQPVVETQVPIAIPTAPPVIQTQTPVTQPIAEAQIPVETLAEQTPNTQTEEQNISSNNLGYVIAMPEEYSLKENPDEILNSDKEETQGTEQHSINKSEEIKPLNIENSSLEKMFNEVNEDEDEDEEDEEKNEQEKYTISTLSTQPNINSNETENYLAPIVDTDTDEDEIDTERIATQTNSSLNQSIPDQQNQIQIIENGVPNIQAVSAVPDVAETTYSEEQTKTASNILADPGIRIANNETISTTTEINNPPILPNQS